MHDDLFRARVAAARAEHVRELRGRLVRIGPTALDTLEDLMTPLHQPSVRLAAARAALSMAVEPRRRFDAIEVAEFQQIVSKVMDAASREMGYDGFRRFVQTVQTVAGEP
jgi:hypothetical protein